MIQSLKLNIPEIKQVWLADNSAGGESLAHLYNWCILIGNGYLVNGLKWRLIVKTQDLAREQIFGDEVNITTEGKRQLRAVIGSKEYKDQECRDKVQGWRYFISSRNRKKPTACCLHCPHKSIQILIHLLCANNWGFQSVCRPGTWNVKWNFITPFFWLRRTPCGWTMWTCHSKTSSRQFGHTEFESQSPPAVCSFKVIYQTTLKLN